MTTLLKLVAINENNWEIIQDVAWQDYELVPKLTMSGYSVMIKEISEQTNSLYNTYFFTSCWGYGFSSYCWCCKIF